MYNDLKKLLSEATITVTKSRGKQEITFSFGEVKVEKPINNESVKGDRTPQPTGLTSKDGKEVFVVKKETPEPGEIKSSNNADKKVLEQDQQLAEGKTPPDNIFKKKLEETKTESELTEVQVKRINRLAAAGFIENKEEKQFVKNGIGVGTAMILGCSDEQFETSFKALKENIAKNTKEAEKPQKSFSDFQAEQIEFEELVEENDSTVEVVKETAPAPKPMAPISVATPVETVEDKFNRLVKEVGEAGYAIDTLKKEDYPTLESLDPMFQWLKDNPLEQV